MAATDDLSLNAWAVLTLLVDDGPHHGFALARKLGRTTEVGRVWSVSRPLVYRALDQLERRDLAFSGPELASPVGPSRQDYTATVDGAEAVNRWRSQPVRRLRDVRPDLLLKLTLAWRAEIDLRPLLAAQAEQFSQLLAAPPVTDEDPTSPTVVVDTWREEQAYAIDRTLSRLAGLQGASRSRPHRGPRA